jgi:peptidyl-prolyl cis-trans isomerase A (cyclophilin A)
MLILIFLILLGVFALSFTILIKNKCLFVKNFDPQKINYSKPNNIVVLNAECGNVIIELYPEISPNGVERFKELINSKSYDNVAFHRVIKDKLVQAGDIQFGKKNQIDYGMVDINGAGLAPDAPFGGYKHSGIGREAGKLGLEEYLEVKAVSGWND